jgi:hypothetical protein
MMTSGFDNSSFNNLNTNIVGEDKVPLDKEMEVLSLNLDDGPFSQLHHEDGDALVVKAMNSISFEERREALHDLHGVAEIEEDEPVFLDEKLVQLEVELSKISPKKAYYMAKAASPAYVCDREFRLLFLRSDNWSARDAAMRLVRHFETKLDLFGKETLGKDLRLSDLNEQDMNALESGYVQWLPQRDRAGRAVLFWTPGAHVAPLENRFRAMWWGLMHALRDKETQKRGMVVIGFSVGGKMGKFDPHAAFKLPILVRSLPARFVACHVCLDSTVTRLIMDLVLRGLGAFFECAIDHTTVRFVFKIGILILCLVVWRRLIIQLCCRGLNMYLFGMFVLTDDVWFSQ